MIDRGLIDYVPSLAKRGPYAGLPKCVKVDCSCEVTLHQLLNLNNARLFAIEQGTRLNTFITIRLIRLKGRKGWTSGADPAIQVPRLRKRVLQAIADWCRHRGIPYAQVHVVENERGPGPHMHVLMHLPEHGPPRLNRPEGELVLPDARWHAHHAELKKLLIKFSGLDRHELAALSSISAADGVDFGQVPILLHPVHLPDSGGQDSALAKARYLVKGMSMDLLSHGGSTRSTVAQNAKSRGRVAITLKPSAKTHVRKMVGASESIQSSARAKAAWDDTNDMTWLSREIEENRLTARIKRSLVISGSAASVDPASEL